MKKYIKIPLFISLISAMFFVGCSSSSSSSSSGAAFLVSGNYTATLDGVGAGGRNISTQLNISVNQAQSTDTDDNNVSSTTLSPDLNGAFSFAGGESCFRGGVVTGSVNGRSVNLSLNPNGSTTDTITLSGLQVDNNSITGTFSSNTDSNCGNFAGSFELRRQ